VKQGIITPVAQLRALGQSVWIEGLSRGLVDDGRLAAWRGEGIAGVVAGEAEFARSLREEEEGYDPDLRRLAPELGAADVVRALREEDVRRAADVMEPTYEETRGEDGYVSVDIPPGLAHDTRQTIAAARRLWQECKRPNVMVEVPATDAGLPAVCRLVADGINVNASLVSSVARSLEVADAVLTGLEVRRDAGADLDRVGAVVSFSIGRLEAEVERLLQRRLDDERSAERRSRLEALRGRVAVANARLAYHEYRRVFGGPRWGRLRQHGARPLRCLWTGLSDAGPGEFVHELVGPGTVATVPPSMYPHLGEIELDPRLDAGLEDAVVVLTELSELGIDLNQVGRKLEDEVLAERTVCHRHLLALVGAKAEAVCRDEVWEAGEGSFPASDPGPWPGAVLGGPPSDP
jgi:transaldolase